MGAREDGLAEGIPLVWHHDRDPCAHGSLAHEQWTLALDERDVADTHPGHVADGVAGAGLQVADADAQVAGTDDGHG